ncbi:major facilitator superfamily domain-containing protein [Pterulicium gracile]|uniref:Major facilitator superfamily domain-containing protein n=1 Tax=Pterulicium gracile TaxID=1884261 RepID=A0A5C3QVH3_9AGAR|nr:major facilitator superfamily domain-containing protein [Pterula gracilis]
MIPPTDSDPDPTTQMAWPTSRDRALSNPDPADTPGLRERNTQPFQLPSDAANNVDKTGRKKKQLLSTLSLITLTISMAGAQIAWTVELGYGTPFLLGLGLSEQLTSLVWLAGPISGLIAQPVIGAISDASRSNYRRRYWIAVSTLALVVATLGLAWCQFIAAFFVDILGIGDGDWSEERQKAVANTSIGIAVVAFYVLDFALNALQASLRNLLLDIAPPAQLNAGNAWHGRMTHLGNIAGYGFGYLPLASMPFLTRLFGEDQFRNFCMICIVILVITVAITCVSHEEVPPPPRPGGERTQTTSQLKEIVGNIYKSIVELPKPIRRVCIVQLFAFMGWFPFLFYSTLYIGQVMAAEHNQEPDKDYATRKGEFAMLLYSIVAAFSGTLLPHLANRDRKLMAHRGDDDEDAELTRLKNTVFQWKVEAAQKGKELRLPVKPFLLRNIWGGALLWFTVLTWSTFFVTTVAEATALVALVGISWSVAVWAPFAIIMELLKDMPKKRDDEPIPRRRTHQRALTGPVLSMQNPERQPLLRARSIAQYDAPEIDTRNEVPVAGGTILGIHNLSIVCPQFIVAVVASAIFKLADKSSVEPSDLSTFEAGGGTTYLGKNGVAWVLRFGGLCTLFGAVLTRMVAPTPTEKSMRRRLAEMKLLKLDSSTP